MAQRVENELRPALSRFPRRIIVAGSSSTGKSTLGKRLAALTGFPCVELDALYWEANWTPAETDVFRARVAAALSGGEWIVDGNYAQVRDLTWAQAEHMIWLDYSLVRTLWQLTRRTYVRIRRGEVLWNGNRERLSNFLLSRDSLYWWVLKTHHSKRRRYPVYLQQREMQHLSVVRVRSPRQLETHVRHLEQLLALDASRVAP